ncbi:MAG: ParB/RepB/Spo0J family partition protein [Gammaproteobacteria bacterium]|nr:ParB/RepB/Spo0J family partition protein [Gammaproteobacteria bacterium]MBU1415974.1 ParB/RepB/Spo0J family partition protein [Gammaproteobacteria bacterium]
MTPPKMKGLGRGLDALLAANSTPESSRQETLTVGVLRPGKYQPRTRMDPGSLEELAASIKAQGLIQPISVRPVAEGRYEIIAGERRWRAAQIAGLNEVPVLIRDIPDEAVLAMSLIENIQREDLNPLEEAAGLQRLIDEFNMTHQQAADAVGRSRSAASNLLRLLQLAKPAQDMLMAGDIEMGHARALLPLPKGEQARLASVVVDKGWSVRETERAVARELNPPAHKTAVKVPDRDLERLEEDLADNLGASVKIVANRKGAGSLTIRFASLDQLDGLLARLQGGNGATDER